MSAQSRLSDWIRTHQHRTSRLVLVRGTQELHALAVTHRSDGDELASELIAVASADLDQVGGALRFHVVAFKEGQKPPVARTAFELRDTDPADASDDPDKLSPTVAGMLSQQMAHNRALIQASSGATSGVIAMLQKMLLDTMKRCERMEKRHADLFETLEDLISQRHLRELAAKSAEASERRKDTALEKVSLLAPVVVQKLTGTKLTPDQPNATELTLAAFMESLQGEQLERLKAVLTPEQLAVMFSLYQAAQSTAEKGRAGRPNGHPSNGAG